MKNAVKKIVCGLIAFIMLLGGGCVSLGEATPRTVRVACGINNALYLDASGNLQGYCAHYLRQIAWLNNWNLQYVEVTWAQGLQYMQSGQLDLMLPVQMSDAREEYLDYSDYIGGYEAIGLFANEDVQICFNEYEAMNKKRIGVEKSNLCSTELEAFAQEHGLTYTLIVLHNSSELAEALHDGTVDMIVSSTMDTVPDSKLVAVLDFQPFYYCTADGDTALMAQLNEGMRQIMINSPDMAITVYGNALKGTAFVGYTRAEEEIIEATDKLVVAMYDDSLPLSGRNKDGECVGIYIDLIQRVQDLTGIVMEPMLISTDEFIFDYLDAGTVDYVMCTNRLPYLASDTSGYLGSDPISDYAAVAVTRPDYNLDEEKNPVFALTEYRKYLQGYIDIYYPDAQVQYYSSTKDCMVAVQQRKADAAFVNSWEYNYQSKNSRFQGMMEWENTRVSSDLIVVTTTAKNPDGLAVVDKAFHQIPKDEVDRIIASNVNMPYSSYDASDTWDSLWKSAKGFAAVVLFLAVLVVVYLYMRKKNVRALMEKNRELENANQAKTIFLSRMSHELRTPLNAIAGYAQEQENNCLSPDFDINAEIKATGSILRAVRYQQSIVGDLLNMRQIESGKIELAKEKVDAATYMNDVVEMIRPEAEAKQIHFTYERLTTTNETYLIDPVRVQQILFNLLHNAIKFTSAGGTVKLTAQVMAQEGNAVRLKFVVADTGIGMSKEFIETKLFQNFAQEYTGNTSPYDGCGIGLATCKELVHLMDGSITCESRQGEGSVFTVEIGAEAIRAKRRERRRREPIPCDLTGVRVLLCEDNEMNQNIEKKLLERMGCVVDIAENGAIGCDMFASSGMGEYSVVLMDIRMPEMDGLQAAQVIRAMERTDAKMVPIIAVSANAFEEDVAKSLAAGMNEHLAKPMDARVIREKIKLYCHID